MTDAAGVAIPGTRRRPSPAASKRKGADAEIAVCKALQAAGYPAERRHLAGAKDRGDIAGLPLTVIEVKDDKSRALPAWLRDAETERVNDGAAIGVVWHKLRGSTDAMNWCVSMSPLTFLKLLAAMYGDG